ncbi:uncharacterized protein DSM5745_08285 [Aspergillus mulundensis]|uniref:Uncharacterized protein n=1 Tax=Aspergillus mulundensis TaxID=1810919 RepID=A0A3D8RA81_9EURO|nr:Uncharacterized protein DSM5745_08285 [Aspergillus mulundensis]RDW70774.1 Uncharacterized protein DSM5745_08285 [Aspergillus mulundensis]
MLFLYLYVTFLLSLLVSANVEKTIFIAPSAVSPDPALGDLGLERLTPANGMLRTRLNASFLTEVGIRGTDSWYLLENLNPGQRYEVRICWLATQPTAFTLSTYTVPELLEDRALLDSISSYSSAAAIPGRQGGNSDADSVLFLRISAAADYFSLDQDLMENVPPVLADIILDPFLSNVFPKSLVPTAAWIGVVSLLAITIARWVAREFASVVNLAGVAEQPDGKKVR